MKTCLHDETVMCPECFCAASAYHSFSSVGYLTALTEPILYTGSSRKCGNTFTEPLRSNDRGTFTEPLRSNDRGIFTEPLRSNDKGIFTEPLRSNYRECTD
jgi:hypothetical protein